MWSVALDAILTTLRYLAPATLLTLFWGQQSFFFKILKHIDYVFRSIVFSSEEQKQSVLKWMTEAGTVRVEHLDTVWRHGWILCGILDAALPGACAGHPATRLTLKHAQAIADHYLGVEPVFSRQELESNDSLSRHQEWKLATYLDRIRQALAKLTPPVSKPTSQRTSPETTQFTFDYVAKGSGLTAAQVKNKMSFKIYPTAQQCMDPGEITILIRGPKDTYGMSVFPPVLGKAQMIRQKLLGLQAQQNYTENALPITHGAAYYRAYGKNDMNKTYYIPKAVYDIEIDVDMRSDHAKISYTVLLEGRYEISITSRGLSIVGSPFSIIASHNVISILEKDSFCLEDGEEIDIVDVKNNRKVVLRIVDFVTEKMLLNENGSLEKISDEEANILMTTNSENETSIVDGESLNSNISNEDDKRKKVNKFNDLVHKIITMNKVCKIMNSLIHDKKNVPQVAETYISPTNQQFIPDVVNSTFSDVNTNPFIMAEQRSKFIVPENISVSLRTEKSKLFYETEVKDEVDNVEHHDGSIISSSCNDSPDGLFNSYAFSVEGEEDNNSIDRMTPLSSNTNPFINDNNENFIQEKDLGIFVISEYETNNSLNEETPETPIKIVIDSSFTPSMSPNNNPFLDDDLRHIERPKSPVFKLMPGDIIETMDPQSDLISEDMLGNEFVNPFFIHHHQPASHERLPIADFIIGAPVSLPPIVRGPSPEPDMKSLMISTQTETSHIFNSTTDETDNTLMAKPDKALLSSIQQENMFDNEYNSLSTSHSLELKIDNVGRSASLKGKCDDQELYGIQRVDQDLHNTSRKETWDSAYVSIDDNNSSPDTNNNENTTNIEMTNKQSFNDNKTIDLNPEDLLTMGPAEREIWETCTELNMSKPQEDGKANKHEVKRSLFTPIIEETERSISSGAKESLRSDKKLETDDTVSAAFAEINELYTEYFPKTESTCTSIPNKYNQLDVNNSIQCDNVSVNSSSDLSDVKRHVKQLGRVISEVQTNVAESVSVSQTLHDESTANLQHYKQETHFGDREKSNIVLEKKKYWDERIRQIEANSQETPVLPKRKRASVSSKQMKHDSLSKRKGKQMIKNFLNAGGYNQTKHVQPTVDTIERPETFARIPDSQEMASEETKADEKIVEKWKRFWDEKLIKERDANEAVSLAVKTKQSKSKSQQESSQNLKNEKETTIKNEETNNTSETVPIKQELPEEVFKAFETSPKRFFGTSRKQILTKLDIFSGRQSSSEESSPEIIETNYDSGLVSSRISLFHTLSNTEELPWARRKSKSMHNIYQNKDSGKTNLTQEQKQTTNKNVIKDPTTAHRVPCEKKMSSREESKFSSQSITLANKRKELANSRYSSSIDTETISHSPKKQEIKPVSFKHISQELNTFNQKSTELPSHDTLRKKSFSKSEMDIFSKIPSQTDNDYLDKYKSYDELPKINVKSFISLYEGATKAALPSRHTKRISRTSSIDSDKLLQTIGNTYDADRKKEVNANKAVQIPTSNKSTPDTTPKKLKQYTSFESVSSISENKTETENIDVKVVKNDGKETTYVCLSDIELEIVESSPDNSSESSPERVTVASHVDYKNRFRMAKEYFQSLDELREDKKPQKLNECELLLNSNESLENSQPHARKKKTKSHSMPSSEIAKVWSQMTDIQKDAENDAGSTKLMKISEKFNVDDLFSDVMEGRLSRQGSLRGIPNKKAVLETFRSMENIANNKISSYELAESQLSDFAKENSIKNAQTYLTEYPYLPTTDPSKYHSRLDVKASGLISFKELLEKRPRRNSVPDLRLNPKFTVDL